MKAIAALAIFVLCASALTEREYQDAFTSWMQLHGKSYNHDQFLARYQIFRSNLDFINQHNAEGHSYTVAMNHLGDLTRDEYRTLMLGTKVTAENTVSSPSAADVSLPDSFDWRTKGAVTGVKNQGQCGSCWSFSTTGSTEGCHQISTGNLVGLSEQNLMDCSTSYGNQGCNGGLMTQAMQYIIDNKGIDTEASYPYTTSGPNQCQYSAANIGATLSSYVNVQSGDENDLQTKAATGPVSVAIDASQSSFQFYSGGVYNEPACSSTQLDHGVLVVGWGSDSGTPYWIVKNSWGTSWGQAGYIWMSRNANNQCGIATMATLPQC